MKWVAKMSIICLISFLAGESQGQDSLRMRLTAEFLDFFWTNCYNLKCEGNFLYASAGSVYRIIDISDPTTPVETSKFLSGEAPENSVIQNGFAYVKAQDHVIICDVSDPYDPQVISRFPIRGGSECMQIDGDYLYLGSTGHGRDEIGLWIVDVSDPTAPTKIGELPDYRVMEITLVGNYAYCSVEGYGGSGGQLIADISDPENIRCVNISGDFGAPKCNVFEGYLYVQHGNTAVVTILDISDPEQPHQVGEVDGLNAGYDLYQMEDHLIGWNGSRLCYLDISDPVNPEIFGWYLPFESGLSNSAFSDGFLYAASFNHPALTVYDVSNPNEPFRAYQAPESGVISDIEVRDDLAYVIYKGQDDYLAIVHVAWLDQPGILSYTYLADRGGGFYYPKCSLSGELLVFTTGNGWGIVNVHSALRPDVLFFEGGSQVDLAVKGNLAFIARGFEGLGIYDFSNPVTPVIIGEYCDSSNMTKVLVQDSLVMLTACYNEGRPDSILLVNVSDPQNPTRLSAFRESFHMTATRDEDGWTTDGKTLFISTGEQVKLHDIGDPVHPRLMCTAEIDTTDPYQKLTQFNSSFLFRAVSGRGMEVWRVRGEYPRQEGLELIGFYNNYPNWTRSLEFEAPYLYIASSSQVAVFDCSEIEGLENSIENEHTLKPSTLNLSAYPNPFNSSTTITFSGGIPPSIEGGRGGLFLRIYDLSGRLVADLTHSAFRNPQSAFGRVVWDAGDLGSGVYFVMVKDGAKVSSQKVLLMR